MNEAHQWTPEDRRKLVELLERFNLSVESFDNLRSDAYEHALARHSLEHLELLYTELTKPGNREPSVPPWPPMTPRAGKLPSTGALSEIGTRLRTEQTLNSLGRVSGFLDSIQRRASALSVGQQGKVLDTVISLVGEELIQAKLGGAPMLALLPVVDRLLTNEGMKSKGQLEEKKLSLRERAEDRAKEALALEQRKFMRATAESQLDETLRRRVNEIAASGAPRGAMIEQVGQAMFGDLWK
jgi:hypothetical protein